jgi:hypothetical protein
MSFDSLSPPVKAAKASEPVRVGVTARKAAASPSRLCILIKRDVIDQVAKGATRATVELGKAEDLHLVRVRPNAKGEFVLQPTPRGGPLRIALPPHARWPGCAVKTQAAAFKVGKGFIDIELPAWAWDQNAKRTLEQAARAASPA